MKRVTQALWITAVLLSLLLSLYCSIFGYLFSQLPHYKGDIEAALEQALGVPITIGQLDGHWNWLHPALTLQGIEINPALPESAYSPKLDYARVQLNLLASMVTMKPTLGRFDLSGLHVTVERAEKGAVRLLGLPQKPRQTAHQQSPRQGALSNREQLRKVVDALLEQESIYVNDYTLRYLDGAQEVHLKGTQLLMSKQGDQYAISTDVQLVKEQTLGFRVIAHLRSDSGRFEDLEGRFFIDIAQAELGSWLSDRVVAGIRVDRLQTHSQIWGEIQAGQLVNAAATLVAQEVHLVDEQRSDAVVIDHFSAQVGWSRSLASKGVWHLNVDDINLVTSGVKHAPIALQARIIPESAEAHLLIDRLPLEPLGRLYNLSVAGKQKGEGGSRLGLELTGSIKALRLDKIGQGFTLSAAADNVGVQLDQFGLTGISGQWVVEPERGAFHVDAEAMSLSLPRLYDAPLSLRSLQGPIVWRRHQSAEGVDAGRTAQASGRGWLIESGKLKLANDDAKGAVLMALDMPDAASKAAPELRLIGTLNKGRGEATPTYLPASIPPQLLSWLKAGDIQGDLLQGDFLYHGPLKFDPTEVWRRTFQMRFLVDDGTLIYDTGWPKLEKLHTHILLDNRAVYATVYSGQVADADLRLSHVFLPETPFAEARPIRIRAGADGSTKEGLNVLTQSSIKSVLPELIQMSRGEGALGITLDMDIPLLASKAVLRQAKASGLVPSKPKNVFRNYQVEATLKESQFDIDEIDLHLKKLNGTLRYSAQHGLYSPSFKAEMLGETLSGAIHSTLTKRALTKKTLAKKKETPSLAVEAEKKSLSTPFQWESTTIALSGNMSIERLYKWKPVSLLLMAQGKAPFNAELHFNREAKPDVGHHFIEIHSDLEGIALNVPKPLHKPAEHAAHLFYQMSLGRAPQYVMAQIEDRISTAVELNELGEIERAKIHFGNEPATLPDKPGILVNGRIEQFHLEEWLRFGDADTKASGALTGSNHWLDRLRWVDLNFGELNLFDTLLDDLSAQFMLVDGRWILALQNRNIAAFSHVPEALLDRLSSGVLKRSEMSENPWLNYIDPIEADIQYLRLPFERAEQVEAANGGILMDRSEVAGIDPRRLPSINLDIKHLYLDNEAWGSWQAQLRPHPNGVELMQLQANVRELSLDLTGEWLNTVSEEGVPNIRSRVEGHVRVGDVAKVMSAWGYVPSMTSERGLMNVDLSWQGGLYDFDPTRTEGQLVLDIEKGELLDVDSAASTVRVIGLLNIHTLQRRLQLDFRDLFNKGLAYDTAKGTFDVSAGVLTTPKLRIEGPSAQFEISGRTDLKQKEIDHTLKITLPISRNLVLPAAAAGGLPLAATAYLVERALGDQLDKLTTFKVRAVGDWNDPKLSPVNQLDDRKGGGKP